MAERIDVYDANLTHIGAMDRLEAHKEGKWHRTFHCWVVSSANGGQLLFQKRSDNMRNFPGLLDVSAAGHLEAGETIDDGLREVTEELGIPIDRAHLHSLGERVEVADQTNGQRNREYQSVYLYQCDLLLTEYHPQVEEVAALLWLPIKDGYKLFDSSTESVVMTGYTYERSAGAKWEPFEFTATRDTFLPRIQRYYLASMIMAERLLNDAGPLAIS